MTRLQRYLRAVRLWLPPEQQEDILSELADDLRSQVEEKQAELGRELDDAELAAILKKRGHPLLVAGQYLPQQYVIGPGLYPTYRVAIRVLLLWVMVPVFVLIVGPIAAFTSAEPGRALVRVVWELGHVAIYATAIVTLVFALLERGQVRFGPVDRWEPSRLTAPTNESRPTSRLGPILELAIAAPITAWWLDVVWAQTLFNNGVVSLSLSPAWQGYRFAILVLALAGIAAAGLKISWPDPTWLRSIVQVVIDGSTVMLAVGLLWAPSWIEVSAPSLAPAAFDNLSKWVNSSTFIVLGTIGITSLLGIVLNATRLVRARKRNGVLLA